MNDSYEPKTKLSKFLAGKGFYVALAICVVGAGTAAWVAVDKTLARIDDSNNSIMEQQSPSSSPEAGYGFPDLEEAGKAQSDISITNTPEPTQKPKQAPASSSSSPASSSSKPSSTVSQPSTEVAGQPTPPQSSFVLPLSGEIFVPFSNGELVKNTTLKEWRTHDGIDIKADTGATVKAVCDGTVTAVKDDPLMGMTIEIQHQNDIISVYCGLEKKVTVKEGDTVKVGQAIGTIGEIPCEIKLDPHLHFAMKAGGKWVDPLKTMGKVS